MPADEELLRPVLEAALVVARAGERSAPAVPAPQALRGVLHFKRFPAVARDVARRALDEDVEFRERVADEVTEAAVGEAGWLYVTRPEGWERTFAAMVDEQAQRDALAEQARSSQQLERRLLVAEDLLRQERLRLRTTTEQAEQARTELAEERRIRRTLQEQVEHGAAAVAAAEAQRDAALVERDEAVAAAAGAAAEADGARARAEQAERDLASASVAEPPQPSGPDGEELGRRATEAAAEARRLAEELEFLANDFVDGARPLSSGRSKGRGPAPRPSPAGPAPPSGGRRRATRRGPAELPPGVMDGSVDAAGHLLRLPGVVVLVDGYNVTKRVWGDVSIGEQRDRLVRALDDLSLRTGARPTVVFDGADVVSSGRREGTRSVQVLYSPPSVSADAIVLECIGRCEPHVPVVVVSSDNEVRDGARARGARLLHAEVFFDVLRR